MTRTRYWFWMSSVALLAIYCGAMDQGQLLPQTILMLVITQVCSLLLIYQRAKDLGLKSPWVWACMQGIPILSTLVMIWFGVANKPRSADAQKWKAS